MKKIDYKGKYFILQDDDYPLDDMDFVIGEMKDEDITDEFLKSHVETCCYYGIPPVITTNKKLHNRVVIIEAIMDDKEN